MADDWLTNAYEGMSRRQFLARMSAAGVSLVGFAMAAAPVAGEIVTTPKEGLLIAEKTVMSDGFAVPIYEAFPAKEGRYPIIVVIPEIFGMHEHIRDVVRRFAHEGFLAVTFEPYARDGGVLHLTEIDSVRKVANGVPDERVMKDLDAMVAAARTHPAARADKLGITGFCRGGSYTILYAARTGDVNAAVAWYGQIKTPLTPGVRTFSPLDVSGTIRAPFLGLYGDADAGIPAADVKEMEAVMKAADRTAEFVIYPEAPHAFHADYRPSYRAEAARDAWHRCIEWFRKYLA
jgi:carboxymethylenebutenolidase